jgi:hypothetical protein
MAHNSRLRRPFAKPPRLQTFPKAMSRIDLIEAEAAQQIDSGGIVGARLDLDKAEKLILKLA